MHPFDDLDLISGQGTVRLEIHDDWPEVEIVVVPIGGGGLIWASQRHSSASGRIRIVGVESADGPAMQRSVEAGELRRARPLRHDRRLGEARRRARVSSWCVGTWTRS